MTIKASEDFSLSLILDNIMKNMPGHVYWKDKNGTYLGCNDKQARLLGFACGQNVTGKTDFDLPWPEESAQQFYDNDQRIIRTGKAEVIEEQISAQGDTVLSIKAPIQDDVGVVFGVLGISIDITEKKHAEQLLKEKEMAEKNAALMKLLSASIAHEIRTPLAIIKINANLIEILKIKDEIQSETLKQDFSNYMRNIEQALKESSQVIDMLLVKLRNLNQVSGINLKMETQKNAGTFKYSINETIQKALNEYPFRAGEKVSFMPTEDFDYLAEERLIKHVFFNLIRNALAAMQQAQKGEIFIRCIPGSLVNQVIVRDTATGIAPESLCEIFKPFATGDEVYSGIGLGLAFCRWVMESAEGKIECFSEKEQWTEFVLSFPKIEAIV